MEEHPAWRVCGLSTKELLEIVLSSPMGEVDQQSRTFQLALWRYVYDEQPPQKKGKAGDHRLANTERAVSLVLGWNPDAEIGVQEILEVRKALLHNQKVGIRAEAEEQILEILRSCNQQYRACDRNKKDIALIVLAGYFYVQFMEIWPFEEGIEDVAGILLLFWLRPFCGFPVRLFSTCKEGPSRDKYLQAHSQQGEAAKFATVIVDALYAATIHFNSWSSGNSSSKIGRRTASSNRQPKSIKAEAKELSVIKCPMICLEDAVKRNTLAFLVGLSVDKEQIKRALSSQFDVQKIRQIRTCIKANEKVAYVVVDEAYAVAQRLGFL